MEIITSNLSAILNLVTVLSLVLGVGGLLYGLKSGRITSDILSSGAVMLDGIQSATDALYKATGNPAVSVVSFIIEVAGKAARAAEQLYNTGAITKAERNAKAKEIAEDLLRMAGIEVTDDRKAAIAVLLEAECDAMGHSIKASATLEDGSAKLGGFGITFLNTSNVKSEDFKVMDVREEVDMTGKDERA